MVRTQSLWSVVRGGGPGGVFYVEFFPEGAELNSDPVDELLRRDAFLFRGLLNLLPVLIHTGEEEDFLSLEPVIAGEDVGEHLFVGMPDVRRAVSVVDGGGDEEGGLHIKKL